MPNVALYRSEDGGKTISIVRGAPGGDDYHQLWIDPKDSSRMILGTDQGATISLDYGKTWSSWYNQPTAQLYHVITDNQFPYTFMARSRTAERGGAQPHRSRADHTARLVSGRRQRERIHRARPERSEHPLRQPRLMAAWPVSICAPRSARTSLRGRCRTLAVEINERKYRDPWTPVLLFSPFDKKTLYLGTQYVMKTLDGGLHWEKISPDLTGSTQQPGDKKPEGPPTVENAKERGYGVVYTIAPSPLERQI